GRGLAGTDRHRGEAVDRILPGRGVSPGVLSSASGAGLLRGGHRAEGGQVPRAVRVPAEGLTAAAAQDAAPAGTSLVLTRPGTSRQPVAPFCSPALPASWYSASWLTRHRS